MTSELPGTPVPRLSVEVISTLQSLRPPSARPAKVISSYQVEPGDNLGLLLEIPSGEPVIAAGDGKVTEVTLNGGGTVVIDHGNKVSTVVNNLGNIRVVIAQVVTRGQEIATQDRNVLFQLVFNDVLFDPAASNRHFKAKDGFLSVGLAGSLESAPDVLPNDGSRYYDTAIAPAESGGFTLFPL